ncbi:unnamed protein product [Closterium sp. NIES-54]
MTVLVRHAGSFTISTAASPASTTLGAQILVTKQRPRWAKLLRTGVAIFDLDFDAILAAMYALFASAEGDCYLVRCPLSEGLGFESQCVHFGHPSAGGCQRSTGDPRLILGKGYRLVVLGGYGRTDPLLNKPFYPNGLVVGIPTYLCVPPDPGIEAVALGSEGLGFESQCVHFGHPSAGGCQRSTGDPRLILGKGYRLVVLGGYGRTDPLLNKPFYPNGLVVGIPTYLCVPPDPGIEVAALGVSEFVLPGTALAEALHTFTHDSNASHDFYRDSTTLTPLSAPVPVRLADPCGGPVLPRSSTVLSCLAVPSGSLSGLHLPSFSTNLVSTAALQDEGLEGHIRSSSSAILQEALSLLHADKGWKVRFT